METAIHETTQNRENIQGIKSISKMVFPRTVLEHCKCSCFGPSASVSAAEPDEEEHEVKPRDSRRGGWRTLPFIVGNEMCEKLAVLGLHSNLMVYLKTKYNIKQTTAANMLNVWSGTTSFGTLAGAFVADGCIGKFWTIAAGCVCYMTGMVILTMTALISNLRPAQGESITAAQKTLLVAFFLMMTLGSAGIRPCSMAFGAEQMEQPEKDEDTKSNKKFRVQSFFNWYYLSTCVAVIIALTVIVYIQSEISWSIGFGICAALMLLSTLFFFVGAAFFRHIRPQGSPFTTSARVLVAAFKKRRLAFDESSVYRGVSGGVGSVSKRFGCLNKATMATEGDVAEDGSLAKPWRLTTVAQVEDLKSIIRTLPIFSCGIVSSITVSQLSTFAVSQALVMDRRIGSIKVPAGSFSVFSMLTLMLWLPIYDCLIVPLFRRYGREITTLERMGIGYAVSALSMVVAGAVEGRRRGKRGMSATWLIPQFSVVGLAEAFHAIGHLEFFYCEFPVGMRSTAIAVSSCTQAVGRYLSAVLVNAVEYFTSTDGRSGGWLDDDLDRGHLDRFYYLLAAMEALNVVYFAVCARWYCKTRASPLEKDRGKEREKKKAPVTELCSLPT